MIIDFPNGAPSFGELISQDKTHEVCVRVGKTPAAEVPKDEAGISQFCLKKYGEMVRGLSSVTPSASFASSRRGTRVLSWHPP